MVLGEEIMSDVKGNVAAQAVEPSRPCTTLTGSSSIMSGNDGGATAPVPVAVDPPLAQRTLRALVVDDNKMTRRVHKAKLRSKLGYEVEVAEDGQKAVDLHLAGASFDLIIMDRDMPFKNGPEATRELRTMGVRSTIVGVTSHGDGPERRDFLESGLDACFCKPLYADALANLLNR